MLTTLQWFVSSLIQDKPLHDMPSQVAIPELQTQGLMVKPNLKTNASYEKTQSTHLLISVLLNSAISSSLFLMSTIAICISLHYCTRHLNSLLTSTSPKQSVSTFRAEICFIHFLSLALSTMPRIE